MSASVGAPTLFTRGYWGFGQHPGALVEAVDAVERARGFDAPLFADLRISRGVRAAGFRERAFERTVGADRYAWLPELGNRHVATRSGPRIQIAEPAAAERLLDLALDGAARGRRVLCFCACERPGVEGSGDDCHRVTVGRLVPEAAARRGASIRTVEWPGGEPLGASIDADDARVRTVRRGRASVPLGGATPDVALLGLPWGSIVRLRAASIDACIVSGPALRAQGGWHLRVLALVDGSAEAALARARRLRAELGYDEPATSARRS